MLQIPLVLVTLVNVSSGEDIMEMHPKNVFHMKTVPASMFFCNFEQLHFSLNF